MVIAVASGKGGTGKTFISTNLFKTLLDNGVKARLVDCDVEVPNSKLFFQATEKSCVDIKVFKPEIDLSKCNFCGECSRYCVYNAILCVPAMKKIKLIDTMCHSCRACETACRTGAIKPSQQVIGKVSSYEYNTNECLFEGRMAVSSASGVPVIKEAIKKGSSDGIVILDSPPGTSCPFIQTSLRADLVVLVTEPTPFGLSDLNQAMSTLDELKVPYVVVMNKCDIGFDYKKKIKAKIIAEIPFSRDFARGYAKGEVLEGLPQAKIYFEAMMNFILSYEKELSMKNGEIQIGNN